ncbi:MAG: 3-phosphoshikimate 1-carboxyvinyltransferase [Desulfovibrio sp.]|nr:3-phosphoshikimate 1-carboxyvinyltransferase [Desulfovibrio sp.]
MGDKEGKGRGEGRLSLKEEAAAVDRQILRLLLKRHNLLEKMRKSGRLDTADEIYLRESWQREVARVSKDAELSSRFFALMQNARFMPKPAGPDEETGRLREAFNLAPSRSPAKFSLIAPPDSAQSRSWLYVAACAGAPLCLSPAPAGDAAVDFIQALTQMGAAVTREENAAVCRGLSPMGYPDKVLFAGDSAYNFYLILAHYIGRHSHCKISGGADLKLADFSAIRNFLAKMGARMIHIVPKSSGLPVRLECSGILPPSVVATPELPAAFLRALILAALFYEKPLGFDLSGHPRRASILARVLPILENCGATFTAGEDFINIQPTSVAVPERPSLALDPEISCFILGVAAPLGGNASLAGRWPEWPETTALWNLLLFAGAPWKKERDKISVEAAGSLEKFLIADAPEEIQAPLPDWAFPLLTALAVCAALKGGDSSLPRSALAKDETVDFLRICQCRADEDGHIRRMDEPLKDRSWNAPAPGWAMALALAACARERDQHFSLGNPGIALELWPAWWTFYNSLPSPRLKKETPEPPAIKRRRILTQVAAELPEPREEDW